MTRPLAASIPDALRDQLEVSDVRFDRLFPAAQRLRSYAHWTPVEIAIRAARLLAPTPDRRVLDVGSGVGKVCLVGALATRATWTGIETDFHMTELARRAATQLGIDTRVEFQHGDATAVSWAPFDAIYLFNPFSEILIDHELDPLERRDRYVETVQRAETRLAETRAGTRVVTYHGFGGELPDTFTLVGRQPAGSDELCLWMRR